MPVTKCSCSFPHRWGCDHEEQARDMYQEYIALNHQNVEVTTAGLHLHPEYPFLGASPDGLVQCDCCGRGVLEIKCPFCLTKKDIYAAAEDKQFCLKNDNGTLRLNHRHKFYHQVQLQLLLTGAKYCDFMVWAEVAGSDDNETFLERIEPDRTFTEQAVGKAKLFFVQCILPELVSKWFSRKQHLTQDKNTDEPDSTPCYCKDDTVASSLMICKSGFCQIKYFHQVCLGLKNPPKRKWLCPDCRTISRQTKK